MRWIKGIFLTLFVLAAILFVIGPYEPVETDLRFDASQLEGGVDAYFERIEAGFDDIRPDSEKRVVWHGEAEAKTPLSVVYLHGFSASWAEIWPVPETLAERFEANLVYTRFAGHGRSNDAMAEGSVKAWMQDAAEAMAAARAVGDEVIIMSTSTGGTIAALVLLDAEMSADVKAAIFVSPNFGINNPMAPLLTLPAARHWLPLFAGQRRSFEPQNPGQAQFWTTEYPSEAVFPMAAMVKHAIAQDYSDVNVPALFYYSDDDRVVRPDLTARVMETWGGVVTRETPLLTETDDSYAHVVTGDIMSPGNTGPAIDTMQGWIKELD